MVELEVAVGHAGDVVGDAAPGAEHVRPSAKPAGKFLGPGAIPVEQLPQSLLGRQPHREDSLAAVNPREQKPLEFPFAGRDVGGRSDDPSGVGAGAVAEGPTDIVGGADGQGVDRGPGSGNEPGDLKIDQLEKHGAAELDADEPAVTPADPFGGGGHQR